MIKLLLAKWFGVELGPSCDSCEILREQLHKSDAERRELLQELLKKNNPEPSVPTNVEELKPILPQRVPWHVRQQMLEAEDRKQAELIRNKAKEIKDLEKELGVEKEDAGEKREAV